MSASTQSADGYPFAGSLADYRKAQRALRASQSRPKLIADEAVLAREVEDAKRELEAARGGLALAKANYFDLLRKINDERSVAARQPRARQRALPPGQGAA